MTLWHCVKTNTNSAPVRILKVTSSCKKDEFVSPFELFSFLEELCSPLLCENDTLLLLCRLPTPVLRMEALLPASVIFRQSKIHSPFPHISVAIATKACVLSLPTISCFPHFMFPSTIVCLCNHPMHFSLQNLHCGIVQSLATFY